VRSAAAGCWRAACRKEPSLVLPRLAWSDVCMRVQEMLAAGITPKLRSFTPALVAYAEAGNCDKAFEGACCCSCSVPWPAVAVLCFSPAGTTL
jgi:hypothetical protein